MTLADDPFISGFFFPSFLLGLVYLLILSPQTPLSTLIQSWCRFRSNCSLPLRVQLAPVSLNNKLIYHKNSTLFRRQT
jgi:hypothetical protein